LQRIFVPLNFKRKLLHSNDRSQFQKVQVDLSEGTPQAMLSKLRPASGYQLRHSPIGFRSDFHCTTVPQFVFSRSDEIEIDLQDGNATHKGRQNLGADCAQCLSANATSWSTIAMDRSR
jgi:hypothetical protein